MAPSWRVPFLTDTQSTAAQSGGELVGAHGAKLYAREHAAIRKSSNKRLVPFFYILRSHFWGRNLDPSKMATDFSPRSSPLGGRFCLRDTTTKEF